MLYKHFIIISTTGQFLCHENICRNLTNVLGTFTEKMLVCWDDFDLQKAESTYSAAQSIGVMVFTGKVRIISVTGDACYIKTGDVTVLYHCTVITKPCIDM